jgi:hypothetical protein
MKESESELLCTDSTALVDTDCRLFKEQWTLNNFVV